MGPALPRCLPVGICSRTADRIVSCRPRSHDSTALIEHPCGRQPSDRVLANGRRHPRRQAGEELVGRERENERAVAGALHAVQEATAFPHRKPVQRERRTKDVHFVQQLLVRQMRLHPTHCYRTLATIDQRSDPFPRRKRSLAPEKHLDLVGSDS